MSEWVVVLRFSGKEAKELEGRLKNIFFHDDPSITFSPRIRKIMKFINKSLVYFYMSHQQSYKFV